MSSNSPVKRPTDSTVVDAFTRAILARAAYYDGLPFKDFRRDEREDPLANPVLRRAVIASVLTTDPPRTTLFQLTYRSGSRLNVVRADDLASLADLYIASAVNERAAIDALISWAFDGGLGQHRDLVLEMAADHPLALMSSTPGSIRSRWIRLRPSKGVSYWRNSVRCRMLTPTTPSTATTSTSRSTSFWAVSTTARPSGSGKQRAS